MAQDEESPNSSSSPFPSAEAGSSQISMTTRYTDSEWAAIIEATESNVLSAITQIAKAVPPVDSPEFAQTIDHTLLKIESTRSNIDDLCSEARIAGFAVCYALHGNQSMLRTSSVASVVTIGLCVLTCLDCLRSSYPCHSSMCQHARFVDPGVLSHRLSFWTRRSQH